jgi:membrane-bound lytic murein transglycosylase D
VRRNQGRGRPTDLWSLDLRAETRDYVPKLLAISRLVRNPEVYGLQFAVIPNKPFFEVVDPGRQVHLGDAADLAGITRDDMFALNPAFNRMSTPPKGPHRLLLPIPNAEVFRQAMLDQGALEQQGKVLVAAVEPPPEERHHVKRGETLSVIARKHGVSIDALRAANDLRGSTIHPGQSLLIPSAADGSGTVVLAALAAPREDISAQLPERQKAASAKRPRVHVVKSGDTLWGVARKYGVTVPSLASANGLSSKAGLVAGARLEIPGSGGGSRKAAVDGESSRMTYKVRRGDTLSEIADRFNVTVRELMTWNRLRQSSSLRTGQRLVLYVDSSRQSGG